MVKKRRAKIPFKKGLVYLFTHLATGKKYVGITSKRLEDRIKAHIRHATGNKKYSPDSLQAALFAYDIDAFTVEVLEKHDTVKALLDAERRLVQELNTLVPNGYNLVPGGQSWSHHGDPIEFRGVPYPSLTVLAESFGITASQFDSRRRLGWTVEAALTIKVKSFNKYHRPITVAGREFPHLQAAATEHGTTKVQIHKRLALGWTPEEAAGLVYRKPTPGKRRDGRPRNFPKHLPERDGTPISCDSTPYRSVTALARAYKRSKHLVFSRLNRGWSPEEAVGLIERTHQGSAVMVLEVEYLSIAEACRRHNRLDDYGLIHKRIRLRGWDPDEAFDFVERRSQYREITVDGHPFPSILAACRHYGLENQYSTIFNRIHNHDWPPEDALGLVDRGPKEGAPVTVEEREFVSIKDACRHYKMVDDYNVVRDRLASDWTPEEAFNVVPRRKQKPNRRVPITVAGKDFDSILDACIRYKLSDRAKIVRQRLAKGWTPEEALEVVPRRR